MEFVTSGRVTGGVLYLRNRKRMDAALKKWRDCEVVVTVEKTHATRSQAQNAYYFGVIVATVSDCSGYTTNESHEMLKALNLPTELAERGVNGRLLNGMVIGGSTAKLNKLEFGEYLKSCVQWIAETFSVAVPDPDPAWRDQADAATEGAR